MQDQIKKHRNHTHPLPPDVKTHDKYGQPLAIQCSWKHQLTDNMSIDSAKRLFDRLMSVTAEGIQPWHSRLGNWLIGRGNTNDDN